MKNIYINKIDDLGMILRGDGNSPLCKMFYHLLGQCTCSPSPIFYVSIFSFSFQKYSYNLGKCLEKISKTEYNYVILCHINIITSHYAILKKLRVKLRYCDYFYLFDN